MDNDRRIVWAFGSVSFVGMHVAALAVFRTPFSWGLVGLCLGLYWLRMFAITAGYHRYFAHRSYRTSRAFQLALAVVGAASLQKGPLWWAGHHRHHHRFSDQDEDIHSPRRDGFWWAHVGWILSSRHDETPFHLIKDFAAFPELRWLNRWHLVPGIALAAILLAAGGWPAFVWGFLVSTVVTWHTTFAINSLTHVFGRRRYRTTDTSRNSALLALLTLGEGWHNNHHYYQTSTRQGFFWWEVDISYYILRLLAIPRIVWDLREPPDRVLNTNRADQPEGQTAAA
ncbi:MAG: acyl-CoA desaturase [Thermoanaerobaculales bacterium]|nr:acyl-CoA desaturase [Thermoanaerobaculales bacterium]